MNTPPEVQLTDDEIWANEGPAVWPPTDPQDLLAALRRIATTAAEKALRYACIEVPCDVNLGCCTDHDYHYIHLPKGEKCCDGTGKRLLTAVDVAKVLERLLSGPQTKEFLQEEYAILKSLAARKAKETK